MCVTDIWELFKSFKKLLLNMSRGTKVCELGMWFGMIYEPYSEGKYVVSNY